MAGTTPSDRACRSGYTTSRLYAAIPGGIELLVGGTQHRVAAFRLARGVQSHADGDRQMVGNFRPVELLDLPAQAFARALDFSAQSHVRRRAQMLGETMRTEHGVADAVDALERIVASWCLREYPGWVRRALTETPVLEGGRRSIP